MISGTFTSTDDPAAKMDRMYRWTRHIYDWTRRYYLLGRDTILSQIADHPAGHVLEVGCGTARNLRRLHNQAPHHTLYGLDASTAMLTTARQSLARAESASSITLGQGLAQELDPATQLGTDRSFDVIVFSYVLSMIPDWQGALRAALAHLAPGGHLYIVDFWDQKGWPEAAARLLQGWLSLFDVMPQPALLRTLRRLDANGTFNCTITPIARRYAYRAILRAPSRAPVPIPPALRTSQNADAPHPA